MNERTSMPRRTWLLTAAGAVAAGAMPRTLHANVADDLDDAAIQRLMRIAPVPGLSLATVDGGTVRTRAFGVRRAETSDLVVADTVFEAASLSKPVFAYLVHLLAAEGAIDLDKPLRDYLPLPNPADDRAHSITAKHALSHSTGWRNWRSGKDQALTSEFEPGSRFSYSGEGYYFLQRVVEKITGVAIDHLVRQRVFTPLGMTSSAYVWRPELESRLATPHGGRGAPQDSYNARAGRAFHAAATEAGRDVDTTTSADAEKWLAKVDASFPVFPNFLVPNVAASLMTTARDYGAFLAHLMSAKGKPILNRMMTSQVIINEALRWGLGVGLETVDGRTLFWHWGDNPGFKNFVVGDPSRGAAIVVFTNGNNGRNVYERVVRAQTRTDHPAFVWV